MLTLYLVCLVFGGSFVGLSVLSGLGGDADVDKEMEFDKDFEVDKDFEFDKDFEVDKDFEFDKDLEFEFEPDADIDADADVDGDADAAGDSDADKDIETRGRKPRYNPFFSFKFYTFTSAFFGLTGTALTFLMQNPYAVFGISLAMGLTAGLGMTYLLHVANQSEGGRSVSERDYVGQAAKVILPIAKGQQGKVRLRLRGQTMEFRAESADGEFVFDFDDEVFVLGLEDGVAKVAHPSQLTRRRDS